MRTTILAYAIAMPGLVTIAGGAWSLLMLLAERVPLRYYAIAVGLISGGLAMIGLAQALRLLLEINARG
jgi:hypothetical protein